MKTLPSIHIDFTLHYITLTSYYNAKNTFRSQVITVKYTWKQKKQQSKQNENFPSIYKDFISHYITLTTYYNAKNTFRSQVITVK